MEPTQTSFIPEKYKQFWARFKSAWSFGAVDTITTRFLILFLFALAIPLITVIIFTVSLLVRHMEEATTNQLLLSRNIFEEQVLEEREKMSLLDGRPDACAVPSQGFCHRLEAPASQLPETIRSLAQSPTIPGNFFALIEGHLYLLSRSEQVVRGRAIDSGFLNRIYRHYPNLMTEVWIVQEPIQPGAPLILARSPRTPFQIPEEAFLARLNETRQGQPLTVELNNNAYLIFQEPLFSPRNSRIARVIHILPLSQNQMLLSNYYLGIYIISVASLIFSILLAMLAGRTITQPLFRLIDQVNTLSRKSVMKDEVVITGVYEIRQLGEAFNRMITRLSQEHKLKDEFVATLTHDLKVPLLAEKQTLSYFKQQSYGPLSPEQEEVLDVLQTSNRACLGLVNGLLEVYRYDSGEVSLVLESFNLASLLQETVNELQALAREKSIEVEFRNRLAEDPQGAAVYADRLEIKRVLHNLFSNAITNTPIHGKIHCELVDAQHHGSDTVYKISSFQHTTLKYPVKLEDRLMVVVQDSGIGFSTEDLPYLFKQFAASRGRNPMSIGLGLYNCFQVISAHHGVLWVETTEGEGSAVSFILPCNKQTAQDRRVYRDRRKQ